MADLRDLLTGRPPATLPASPPANMSAEQARQAMMNLLRNNPGTPRLDTQIAATRDKITQMLSSQSAPPGAALRAIGQAQAGGGTFGEAMNAARAQAINEQTMLYNALSNERTAKREERRIKLQEAQAMMQMVEQGLAQGDADINTVNSAIDWFFAPSERVKAWSALNNDPRYKGVNRHNAYQMISRLAAENPSLKRAGGTKEKPSFGAGLEGGAYEALRVYKSYVDSGQQPPKKIEDDARIATHVLSKQRWVRDSDGNTYSYRPGVPKGFPIPPGGSTQEAEPLTMGEAPPFTTDTSPEPRVGQGPEMSKVFTKSKAPIENAIGTLEEIVSLLNEASKSGETITGIEGWAKAKGGGLARQAGVPVTPKAERLNALLITLQGQMGPMILNEKRLSETERKRLEDIVGSLSFTSDDVSLRVHLQDVLRYLEEATSNE